MFLKESLWVSQVFMWVRCVSALQVGAWLYQRCCHVSVKEYLHPLIFSVSSACKQRFCSSWTFAPCLDPSGRASMKRATCRFPLWKAVTLTAPRGAGREIRSSGWWVGWERASETVWVSPMAKSILETISSQRGIFYLGLFAVWWNIVCASLRKHSLGNEKCKSDHVVLPCRCSFVDFSYPSLSIHQALSANCCCSL